MKKILLSMLIGVMFLVLTGCNPIREEIGAGIKNEYEEKYRYDSSLDTAWQNQYFLDTDYKGRVKYQMDEYLGDQLDSLPFPVRYQAYYGGLYNFSIKVCLKGINGDSETLANQRQILLNLFAQYNYETGSKIQNVYFFNIDNTANYQYSFNNSTGNFMRD